MVEEARSPDQSPGVLLMKDLVVALVNLTTELVTTRKVLAKVLESADNLEGWFNVVSRAVELMGEAGHKPNWGDFLECWEQAEDEEFPPDDSPEGDVTEEPPGPVPNGPSGQKKRDFLRSS